MVTHRDIGLRLIVGTRFQVLFHSPHRGSFHLSLTVLVRYRSLTVFSLTPWSGQIHTEFLGLRVTRELAPASLFLFAYGTITLSGAAFQKTSTKEEIGNLPTALQLGPNQPHNPRGTQVCRPLGPTSLGSSRFARRYSGNRIRFLFLRLVRCFSSPTCPHIPYGFRDGSPPMTVEGLPHSGIPGSQAPCASPRLIVAWYALHRLLVPRHPPCALSSLTTQSEYPLPCVRLRTTHLLALVSMQFSRCIFPCCAPKATQRMPHRHCHVMPTWTRSRLSADNGGPGRIRTGDPLVANQVFSR